LHAAQPVTIDRNHRSRSPEYAETYAGTQDEAAVTRFRDVMTQLSQLDAGRSFTRDEMNERQP
jgi:hypothetical protein